MDWAQTKTFIVVIAGIVLMYVGIKMLIGSGRNQYSETTRHGFNVLVALIILMIGFFFSVATLDPVQSLLRQIGWLG